MKKLMILAVAAVVTASVFAQDAAKPRRTRPRGKAVPSGGLVTKEYSGKWIKVLDAQSRIDRGVLAGFVEEMKLQSALPICIESAPKVEGNCPCKMIEAAKKGGAAAVLVLIDDEKKPGILVGPQDAWAVMNVAWLAADFPPDKRLEERVHKQIWRGMCMTLGAGNSSFQPCLMKPIYKVTDLDACQLTRPGPEPFNKMIDSAKLLGATTLTFASYRTACHQGWAASPTNDEQKAIWNEFHTTPTKPLVIKPESERSK